MAVLSVSFVAVLVATVLFWRLFKFWAFRRKFDKIGGPRAYFFLGNVLQFKWASEHWFDQAVGIATMYAKEKMVRVWLFHRPYLMVYGADECEVVMSKHVEKGYEYEQIMPWMGEGLLTSRGAKWRYRRKLLTPAFHYDILKDFVDVFNQQSKTFVGVAAEHVDEDYNIYKATTLCALDTVGQTAMGTDLQAQTQTDSSYVKAINRLNQILHNRMKKPWFTSDTLFYFFGEGKEFNACIKIAHDYSRQVIRERREYVKSCGGIANLVNNNAQFSNEKGRRLAFLDILLGMEERGQIDEQGILEEVSTFMFAGHDTTGTAINWMFFLLGNHPEVQDKVQKELDEIFGESDRDVTWEDVAKMRYLECCIKEQLRILPSGPLLTRLIQEDTQFKNGYVAPAGTIALLNVYMVHRDPNHWSDPEIYRPERFLPENQAGRHPYAFVPFSCGSRNCLGQKFAMMEMKTIVSWLLRYMNIKSVLREDQVRKSAELVLKSADGIHLLLSPRRPLPAAMRKQHHQH